MLGLSGLAQTAIAALPGGAGAPPQSPFFLTDQPNPRGYIPARDLITWVQSVNLHLIGQDKFFGLGGPSYDYPNPRGYVPATSLKTWLHEVNLNLVGHDQFYGESAPSYDYPNPRGYVPATGLGTWAWSTPFTYYGLKPAPSIGLAGLPNYDQPNPRGYRQPIDVFNWINQFNIQLGRVVGTPTLAFSSEMALASCNVGAVLAVTCTASDSPSGQNWSGSGYMAKYEIDTSIQIEGVFLNALKNVYIDPTEVQLFILDPSGAVLNYSNVPNGAVIRTDVGYYNFTFVPGKSGTWTYKWIGTGVAPATSPDTTLFVSPSSLIAG